MSLAIGMKLGPYDIGAPLGAGGMGEVYRAKDTRLNREVAIKVLPEIFASDLERLTRFTREAQTLAALNHPNIAQIFGVEDTPPTAAGQSGIHALVMELVDGDDLSVLIARGPMPLADALPIAKQIADALEAAHDAGIVHRDLKPANIKVRADGTVKVLDFGLAKAPGPSGTGAFDVAASPTLTARATQMGMIIGTAAYMAPEQARGRPVDRRADIWAYGVVLYEMLTGTRAFAGEDISDVVASVLKDEVRWDRLPASLPTSIRRLLRRCLEKDPRRRLSSIGDGRLELEERDAPALAGPAQRAQTPLARMVGAAIVGAITAGGFLWSASRQAPSGADAVTRLSMILPADLVVPTYRSQGVLSPNGRLFAFIGGGEVYTPGAQVWVRPLDATVARPLAGTDGAGAPFWSPDSRTIGFFADGKLKKVPIDGGTPETLCDAGPGRSGAWTDGVIVFAPSASGPLMRVSPSGGDAVPVTTLDTGRGETSHRYAQFLPDGRHFVFAMLPARAGKYDIAVGSLDAPGRQLIFSAESAVTYVEPGYLLFARRRRVVAQPFDAASLRLSGEPVTLGDQSGEKSGFVGGPVVSSSRDGRLAYLTDPPVKTKLGWFDLTGNQLSTVKSPDGYVTVTSLSRDDTRATLRLELPDGDSHWVIGLERGDMTRFAAASGRYDGFVWSPDDRRMAFGNNRNGPMDIYTIATDAPSMETPLLTSSELFKLPSDWSPDSKYIVFGVDTEKTSQDVVIVPVDGDHTPQPYAQTPASEYEGRVSPDGRWMAYASEESGGLEVYVQSFPTPGARQRVGPGRTPAWNRNGTMLAWMDPDGTKLWVADVRPGPEFRASPPRAFGVLPANTASWSLRSDFTRLLATVPTGNTGGASVTVVMNWLAALGKK